MWHLWRLMEYRTCSMSLICFNNLISKWLHMIRNNITNFFIHISRFTIGNWFHEAIVCCFYQCSTTFWYFSNAVSFIHVWVESIVVATDIDVYDVTFLKFPLVWDSMTNDFIDGGAATSWELIIVQRRWVRIMCNNVLVNNSIDFFSGHSNSYSFVCRIDSSSADQAWLSALLNFFRWVHRSRFICDVLKVPVGLRSLGVVRSLDMIWYFSVRCETVWKRSHWSSKSKTRFFFLINFFVT